MTPTPPMTRIRRAALCLALGAAGAGLGVRPMDLMDQDAPPGAPQVQILSPGDEAYVSGPTLLRA